MASERGAILITHNSSTLDRFARSLELASASGPPPLPPDGKFARAMTALLQSARPAKLAAEWQDTKRGQHGVQEATSAAEEGTTNGDESDDDDDADTIMKICGLDVHAVESLDLDINQDGTSVACVSGLADERGGSGEVKGIAPALPRMPVPVTTMAEEAHSILTLALDDDYLTDFADVCLYPALRRAKDRTMSRILSHVKRGRMATGKTIWTRLDATLSVLDGFDMDEHGMIVAGGACASAITGSVAEDTDLFLVGHADWASCERAIDALALHLHCGGATDLLVYRTRGCCTFLSRVRSALVQVILRRYATPLEVLSSFDIGAAAVAVVGRGPGRPGRVVMSRLGVFSYRWWGNLVDPRRRRNTFESRHQKYHLRAWDLVLPVSCLDRIRPRMRKLDMLHLSAHVEYVGRNACRTKAGDDGGLKLHDFWARRHACHSARLERKHRHREAAEQHNVAREHATRQDCTVRATTWDTMFVGVVESATTTTTTASATSSTSSSSSKSSSANASASLQSPPATQTVASASDASTQASDAPADAATANATQSAVQSFVLSQTPGAVVSTTSSSSHLFSHPDTAVPPAKNRNWFLEDADAATSSDDDDDGDGGDGKSATEARNDVTCVTDGARQLEEKCKDKDAREIAATGVEVEIAPIGTTYGDPTVSDSPRVSVSLTIVDTRIVVRLGVCSVSASTSLFESVRRPCRDKYIESAPETSTANGTIAKADCLGNGKTPVVAPPSATNGDDSGGKDQGDTKEEKKKTMSVEDFGASEVSDRHWKKKRDGADFGVFDSYRDFVDFRGPNYKGDLVDIAVRNYQLARERKDPESALVAFERYGQTTRCATVSTLFAGMETSVEQLLLLGKNGIRRLVRIYGEDAAPTLVAMAIEYPAHVADIVRSMSENMAASVSLPPYVERPAIHGATLPNTPEEWCSEPLLV